MQHISVQQLKKLLDEGASITLIDVREPGEHAAFNIGGKLVPLSEIVARITEIPTDRPVYMYCKRGIRSQIAIQKLQQKFPFTNLVNLQGGLEAWKKETREHPLSD